MRSRLNESNCLLRIKESVSQDLNSLEEEYRNQALKELKGVVKLAHKGNPSQIGEPVVHVSPRRFHFYGRIGLIHPGAYQDRYRIRLKSVCWIRSDHNAPQNEIFVTIE